RDRAAVRRQVDFTGAQRIRQIAEIERQAEVGVEILAVLQLLDEVSPKSIGRIATLITLGVDQVVVSATMAAQRKYIEFVGVGGALLENPRLELILEAVILDAAEEVEQEDDRA